MIVQLMINLMKQWIIRRSISQTNLQPSTSRTLVSLNFFVISSDANVNQKPLICLVFFSQKLYINRAQSVYYSILHSIYHEDGLNWRKQYKISYSTRLRNTTLDEHVSMLFLSNHHCIFFYYFLCFRFIFVSVSTTTHVQIYVISYYQSPVWWFKYNHMTLYTRDFIYSLLWAIVHLTREAQQYLTYFVNSFEYLTFVFVELTKFLMSIS